MSNARFVWYELMTADAADAAAFYENVVGWTSRDAGMEGQPYTLMLVGEAQVAGVMNTPKELQAIGAKPTWSGYIGVDDVDAMAARVLQAEGKILRPGTDIPDIGRFAVVADPQGSSFLLFKPSRDEPPLRPAPGSPGTVGWHELHAVEWKGAFEFYSTLFGWTKGEAIDMGPMGVYQLFEIDGVPSGGMMTKPPEAPAPGWRYYINVDRIRAAAARVAQFGGQVVMGPHQVPGGSWIVQGVDPQGAEFALVSMAE
jgi:predicted enzyme related to lactoylglutathione lyase